MADTTPSQVVVESGRTEQIVLGTGGVSSIGQPLLRRDPTTGKYILADADDTAAAAMVICVALETGAADATIGVAMPGSLLDLGAVLTIGEAYALSQTAGSFTLHSNLVTDDYVTFLGLAKTTSLLLLSVVISGVQVP